MIYSISTQLKLIRVKLAHSIAKAISVKNNSVATICIASALSFFAPSTYAEPGKTILVMDASGSMWGKLSDGYKIHIARSVISDMLETLPVEQEIGLVAYGHREKDSCNDIELLVPPGATSRGAISEAIEALDPKGRTPLSAAVIKAADELELEEANATVILISDGEETCSMDPCAVGMELEKRGIDFIAHVVGFDVEKPSDQEQLQCLAENTGGLFFSASSKSELTQALGKISTAMSEAARQVQITAVAQDHQSNPVSTGITWTLLPISSNGDIATTANGNLISEEESTAEKLQATLDTGRYALSVTRDSDGVSMSVDLDLSDEGGQFVLKLPPKARIAGPLTVTIGEIFDVDWEGPGNSGDLIALADSVSPDAKIIGVFTANSAKTTTMHAPTVPGQYQLRYVYAAQRSVIATSILNVEEVPITLDAPDEANVGYLVPVDWQGPNVTNDAIVVAEVGAVESINETGTYLGNPAMVQMPTKPGTYEIRYVLHQDRKVLTSRPITVLGGAVELNAPNEAGVGDLVNVDWVGPNAEHDTVVVAEVGAIDNINETDTYLGNPAKVLMPTEPGEYELRYVLHNGSTIMATRPINVIDVDIVIDAPEQARAGESVAISWVGPDEQHDTITVAEIGAVDSINSTGTYLGNPATVQMPAKPGNYELRYVMHNGRTTMATRLIKVVDAAVQLNAPAEANVGETIDVNWTGPNEPRDVIAVAEVGAAEILNSTGTYLGNPTKLQMPSTPGNYEIRYVLHQGQTVMASQAITVSDAEVQLNVSD